MRWLNKKLHPSAPAPGPLSNFRTICGLQVKKFLQPWAEPETPDTRMEKQQQVGQSSQRYEAGHADASLVRLWEDTWRSLARCGTRLENEDTAETQPWKWMRLSASAQLAAMRVCGPLSTCVRAVLYVGCMSRCMMCVCQQGSEAPVRNRNAQSGSQPRLLGADPIEARLDGGGGVKKKPCSYRGGHGKFTELAWTDIHHTKCEEERAGGWGWGPGFSASLTTHTNHGQLKDCIALLQACSAHHCNT